MKKYYTRVCNFYYGKIFKKKSKKKSFTFKKDNFISFDTIEILTEKIKKINIKRY